MKKNVRLLELSDWPPPLREVESKPVIGGQLVQTHDVVSETREQMSTMTARQPTEDEWRDMLFAWTVCRHVRSNAIVLAAGGATIGIGAGQISRVDAVRIAVQKAGSLPEALAGHRSPPTRSSRSPTARIALDAGITAIIQPGGSVRDAEVVDRRGRSRCGDGRHGRAPLPPLSFQRQCLVKAIPRGRSAPSMSL